MEHESLQYKIVMDDGPDTEVLARVAHLDIASAAYMQAILKYPHRDIDLRQGARVIKRHEGAPKPKPPSPPPDPNMRSWSVYMIGGKKMEHWGFVEAISEQAAIEAAAEKFGLDEHKRKRLAVNPTP